MSDTRMGHVKRDRFEGDGVEYERAKSPLMSDEIRALTPHELRNGVHQQIADKVGELEKALGELVKVWTDHDYYIWDVSEDTKQIMERLKDESVS